MCISNRSNNSYFQLFLFREPWSLLFPNFTKAESKTDICTLCDIMPMTLFASTCLGGGSGAYENRESTAGGVQGRTRASADAVGTDGGREANQKHNKGAKPRGGTECGVLTRPLFMQWAKGRCASTAALFCDLRKAVYSVLPDTELVPLLTKQEQAALLRTIGCSANHIDVFNQRRIQ